MKDYSALKKRIDERYPEGLIMAFNPGGTRTSYILENNRDSEDPGKIADFNAYGRYAAYGTLNIVNMFFEMGGAHAIVPATSFQLLEEKRGPHYPELVSRLITLLHDETAQAYYRQHGIDPYFAGIDLLLMRPEESPQHRIATALIEFHRTWEYQPGRHKLVWEVAPIPLHTFRMVDSVVGKAAQEAFDSKLAAENGYVKMYHLLYDYYADAAYGTHIPIPQFYLSSNRNGDLKPRAFLPFALEASGEMRMYFAPYPSLFMTPESIEAIIEDLLVDKRVRSYSNDYKDQLTPAAVQEMYEYFTNLSSDPASTLGLTRSPFSALSKHIPDD